MVNWKGFKNWLDKEIIIQEGSKVKIKPKKQKLYGNLSEVVLTDFYDSLEATLDKNNIYHLFSPLCTDDFYLEFEELFPIENCYFGKKTNKQRVEIIDYEVLEKLFDEWKGKKNKVNAQNWLIKTYPDPENWSKITELCIISEKENSNGNDWQNISVERKHIIPDDELLEGKLTLMSNFANLRKLVISGQKITDLELEKLPKLSEIYCSNNSFTTTLNIFDCPQIVSLCCDGNFKLSFTKNEEKEKRILEKIEEYKEVDVLLGSRGGAVVDEEGNVYNDFNITDRIKKLLNEVQDLRKQNDKAKFVASEEVPTK
jgi:hypothetical protein